jgi:hypothetical protein
MCPTISRPRDAQVRRCYRLDRGRVLARLGGGNMPMPMFLLAMIVALFGGCAGSAWINVTRHAHIEKPIESLYVIVVKGRILDGAYARSLVSVLTQELAGHVTLQKGVVVTGMELDSRILPKDVERFESDAVLYLKPVRGDLSRGELGIDSPNQYGTLAFSVIYLATLTDMKTKRVIWQAEVEHEGTPAAVTQRSKLAARQIVAGLFEDHIIR